VGVLRDIIDMPGRYKLGCLLFLIGCNSSSRRENDLTVTGWHMKLQPQIVGASIAGFHVIIQPLAV